MFPFNLEVLSLQFCSPLWAPITNTGKPTGPFSMKPLADVAVGGQGLSVQRSPSLSMGVPSLAAPPSTASMGLWSWMGLCVMAASFPGRQGGAVPRLCVRACCWEGFTSLPLLLSPGEVGYLSYLILRPQSLCFMGEDMDDSVTFALAVARAVLCSSRRDLAGSGLLVCSLWTALHLQMCKGTGKPCSCACGCSVQTTLLEQEWSTMQPICCAGMLYCSFIPFPQCTVWVGTGEERSECLCFMSPPCRMETGQLQGLRGCCSPGDCFVYFQVVVAGRNAGLNLWASNADKMQCWLKSPACESWHFHHKGLVTFSILSSMWLLWTSQVISAPTTCLS